MRIKRSLFYGLTLSVTGFAIAAILNAVVPITAAVNVKDYAVAGLTLNINSAYRIVLAFLVILFLLKGLIDHKDPDRWKKYLNGAPIRFASGIALFVWDLLGTKLQLLPQPFFPGPAGIIEAFLLEGDFILDNTLYSLRLYAAGFSMGVIFGVGTGILVGWFPKVYYWVSPVLNVSGVIPAVAWMPFALTMLPTPFAAAVFLIVICVWFPVTSLTAQGIKSTPKVQFEAARTLGSNTTDLVFRVAVPHALPQIFTGISTANAFAFTTLVMAEMMGQPGGLGYYINLSKVWSAYYKVFAAIVVMAVLFSFITAILDRIQKHALRWQKGLVK
ncbi:MAG: ABC transporter permease [Clostridiales bacterium]|nr:ABC transporter permease [Clostridiales bacterium]